METVADVLDDGPELALDGALSAAFDAWLAHLTHERGAADLTVIAYERDLQQFIGFLKRHFGQAPMLSSLATLETIILPVARSQRRTEEPSHPAVEPAAHRPLGAKTADGREGGSGC
jgi:site-specific recombinase XerC